MFRSRRMHHSTATSFRTALALLTIGFLLSVLVTSAFLTDMKHSITTHTYKTAPGS